MHLDEFINNFREFMTFNPAGHNAQEIKDDLALTKKLFCIRSGILKKKVNKHIKDWFYDTTSFTERTFKRISYSNFPDEMSFNFMNCKTRDFDDKFNKFFDEVDNLHYNK